MLNLFVFCILIFFVIGMYVVFYKTIVWARGLTNNIKATSQNFETIDTSTKEGRIESLILKANDYLFPCLQQMSWGQAYQNTNFMSAVQQLLRRENVVLPNTVTGLGNVEILALSAAHAFEIVSKKETDSMELQELYAKEVIKGVVNMKGASFFNHQFREICDYFRAHPFSNLAQQ